MKRSMWFYNAATFALAGIFKFLFRVKVVGQNAKADFSNTIICANHMSNWDPVLVACMVKSPISFMAKDELFRVPVLGRLLKALGAFPIKRDSSDIAAIKLTLDILKGGNNICLFPQGTRHPGENPENTEIKSGISMLLNHSKANILPIAVYTKDYRVKLFRRVYIIVGEIREFEYYNFADNSKEEYQRVSGEIFSEICSMLKKAENGDYGK